MSLTKGTVQRRASKLVEENVMSVERMCHELKYLRQEVEFLKKLSNMPTRKKDAPHDDL